MVVTKEVNSLRTLEENMCRIQVSLQLVTKVVTMVAIQVANSCKTLAENMFQT